MRLAHRFVTRSASAVQNSAHLCCVDRRHRCMEAVSWAEREVKLAACLTRGRRRGLFITEPLNGPKTAGGKEVERRARR